MLSGALNVAIWLPFAAAILIGVLPQGERLARWIALVATAVVLILALLLAFNFDRRAVAALPQFATQVVWIPQLGVSYLVGLDGLSLPLFALNALLVFLAVLVSWKTQQRARGYFAFLLMVETAVAGVFSSWDLFLFFLFWELELAPMYLLIGIWGSDRREYAAMKFILFTVGGSAFMLVGILLLYFNSPIKTFDMVALGAQAYAGPLAAAIWLLLFIGFAVKVPVFPFHTWLPDAHTEAPTAISVLLAGILLKMGGYGLLRVNFELLPGATRQFATLLVVLAVINIVYGALVAMRQSDLKRLIANSSISHMGYVILGAAAGVAGGAAGTIALQGAIFQMVSHGIITGLLFVMVGLVYDRAHTRQISALGGLAARMPFVATGFVMAALASLGLPGMAGFAAEFLVFAGTFPIYGVATILAIGTIVLTAGYLLWLLERVFFGPERPEWARLPDANPLEAVTVSAFLIVIIGLGVYPRLLGDVLAPTAATLAARLAS